jgi:hypothetical protein
VTKPPLHPHMRTTEEYERLRRLREDALASGMTEEEWEKTYSAARLRVLDAWWTLMQTLVDALNETMRGRKVLWLMRQRPVRWLVGKIR